LNTEVILKQIIDKLEGMDTKLSGLENKYEGMDNKLNRLENKIDGMGRRLDAVFEQTAMLTEFKTETEAALAEINKTIESKYDLILRDIELIAGEQGKQRIDIARLKAVVGER